MAGEHDISVEIGIVDSITKDSKKIAEGIKGDMLAMQNAERARARQAIAEVQKESREKIRLIQETQTRDAASKRAAVAAERDRLRQVMQSLRDEERMRNEAVRAEQRRQQQRIQMQRNSAALQARQEAEAAKGQTTLGGAFMGATGFSGGAATLAGMAGAAVGVTAAITTMTSAIRGSIDAANELNKADRALKFVTGSSHLAAQEMEWLRAESNRLGIAFAPVVGQYARLAASAQGTNMTNEDLRKTFTAISQASVVLGMSTDEVAGSFRALGQIMSKGTVQAEEIRGQLGDRLVGSVQLAAKAMGGSMADFNKQLEQGKIISEEFMPAFIKAMDEGYRKQAAGAAQEARAEIQRLHNEFTEGGAEAGEAIIQTYGKIAGWLNKIDLSAERAKLEAQELRKMQFMDPENYKRIMAEKEANEKLAKAKEGVLKVAAAADAQNVMAAKAFAGERAKTIKLIKQIEQDEKDSKERLISLHKELATAKMLAGKEGYDRERAQAQDAYNQHLEAAKGNYKEIAAARDILRLRIEEIAAQEAESEIRINDQIAERVIAANRARRDRILAEQDEELSRRGREQDKLKTATARLEDVNAAGNPLAQLRVQQARELALYAEGSQARKVIEEAHRKETEAANKKHTEDMAAAWMDMANQMNGALQMVAGDSGLGNFVNKTLQAIGLMVALGKQMQAIQAMSGAQAGLGAAGAVGLGAAMPWVGAGMAVLSLGSMLFREDGGPVRKGNPYIVGEKRPEVFVPESDGYIVPSVGKYNQMQGGGVYAPQVTVGGMQITVQGDMTPQATARVEQLGKDYIRKVEKAIEQLSFDRSPGYMRAVAQMRNY